MLKKERQAMLQHEMNLHNRLVSKHAAKKLNVSDDTIRRDLEEMAADGKLTKVHGGAISISFSGNSATSSPIYAREEKTVIGRKAAQLISDGMFILTSGGSTIIEMIRGLSPHLKATFITGSIAAAIELTNHPRSELIMIGDKVSKNAKLTVGADAIHRIKNIRADICFLGVNGVDIMHGITDNDWEVVQIKKAMIESAKKTVCLSISEKLNTAQPIQVAPLAAIHTVITELPLDAPELAAYNEAGIVLL